MLRDLRGAGRTVAGSLALVVTVLIASVLVGSVMTIVRPADRAVTGDEPASVAPAPSTSPTSVAEPTSEPTPAIAGQPMADLVEAPTLEGISSDPRLLLALSPDGALAAYIDDWAGPGDLRVVAADGKSTAFELGPFHEYGPGAAAFAPDGSWLAVVDGSGTLWRIDPTADSAKELMTSPLGMVFGRWLRFANDDTLIVNLVGSSTVPLPSVVATLDLPSLSIKMLTSGGMERGGWPQEDGNLVFAQILPEGGATRLTVLDEDGAITPVGDIGIATWLDVSRGGTAAYSDVSGAVWLFSPGGARQSLGDGQVPRFSPDGQRVAVVSTSGDSVGIYALNGSRVAEVSGPFAGWVVR